MKRARVIVLAIAFTAALGAAWIAKKIVSRPARGANRSRRPSAPSTFWSPPTTSISAIRSRAEDLKWQQWPVEGVTPGLITRDAQPDAPTKLSGAVARAPFIAGEPIKEQKLIKVSEGGVMAAILPAGMRAISTPIREETSAGGFILPNDRVDVILSHKLRRRQQGGAGERGGAAQCPRARHRPGRWRTRTARRSPPARPRRSSLPRRRRRSWRWRSRWARSRCPCAASPTRRPGQAESTAKIGDGNSGSVKFLKYGVPSRAFGIN